MNIFSIGFGLAVFVGFVLALAASIRFLVVPLDEDGWLHLDIRTFAEKRGTWFVLIVYLMMIFTGFVLLFSVVPGVGELARGEISPFPWNEFISRQRTNGFCDAVMSFMRIVILQLWAFLIPGHTHATYVKRKTGRRPWHPYTINILIGLLLSTPHNPIYYLLGGGSSGAEL
jgi:hypothetical protein